MKKLSVFTILFLLSMKGAVLMAQADMSMATHWYNRGNYNPAFIARPDYFYMFSNIRQQWIGVEGAPTVINIQASEYIHNLHSAFGLSFINDRIGAAQAYNPLLTYAYRITGKKDWALNMGLSGGVFSRTINGSEFEAEVLNDPSVNYTTEKLLKPDANVGLELHTPRFIAGISSTHLFSIDNSEDSYLNTNHRYGYIIYKNNNSEFVFYKLGLQAVNRNNLTYFEGNLFLRLKHATGLMKGPSEIFDFGITYRSTRQISVMVGVLVKPNLRIGYSWDQSFINGYYPNSTHEILFEYRIFNKKACPRCHCGGNTSF